MEAALAAMRQISPTPTPTPIIDLMVRAEIASHVTQRVMQNSQPKIALSFGRGSESQDTAGTSQRVTALIAALRDSDAEVRRAAATSLGQLEDKRAVPSLVTALRDDDAEVRQQAAWALGQLEDKRAVDGLMAALKDANTDVRRKSSWALGQLEDPS